MSRASPNTDVRILIVASPYPSAMDDFPPRSRCVTNMQALMHAPGPRVRGHPDTDKFEHRNLPMRASGRQTTEHHM